MVWTTAQNMRKKDIASTPRARATIRMLTAGISMITGTRNPTSERTAKVSGAATSRGTVNTADAAQVIAAIETGSCFDKGCETRFRAVYVSNQIIWSQASSKRNQ